MKSIVAIFVFVALSVGGAVFGVQSVSNEPGSEIQSAVQMPAMSTLELPTTQDSNSEAPIDERLIS